MNLFRDSIIFDEAYNDQRKGKITRFQSYD